MKLKYKRKTHISLMISLFPAAFVSLPLKFGFGYDSWSVIQDGAAEIKADFFLHVSKEPFFSMDWYKSGLSVR